MRVKLVVCDVCHRCMEDDGADWLCTGDDDDRHKRTTMRHAEFVEAGEQLDALLDSLTGVDAIETPSGPFALDALREAYDAAQW